MTTTLSSQLAQLQQAYAKDLLAKIGTLEAAWVCIDPESPDPDAMRDLHRLAHSLAGSGKTFGYPAVSAGAQGIERIIEAALSNNTPVAVADAHKIARLLTHLKQAGRGQPVSAISHGVNDTPLEADATVDRTILIVDDDPNIRALLKAKLEALGLKVITAFDGKEGYAKALSANPDLIITDHVMPNSSGNTLLSHIRSHAITKDIPVIVITAQKVDGRKDHALQRELTGRGGAIAYLEKPLDFADLIKQIRRAIWVPGPSRN